MFKICSKPLVATRKNLSMWRGSRTHLSARACSLRDVQAIEAALGDYVGWNGQPPNTTAAISGKNRRPDRWRDVQQLQGEIGHYIISDRPMSEEQWIRERTLIEAKPNTSFSGASQR